MLGGIPTLPWGWIMPGTGTLGLLITSGLFGGLVYIAMTLAFRYTEASRLAPFEYVVLLWPLVSDLLILRFPASASFVITAPAVGAAGERQGGSH